MKHRVAMPRYALLRHECPAGYRDGPHWDLMIERPGVAVEHRLATWSLLALPDAWAKVFAVAGGGASVEATRLPDHRAAYLDYEGAVTGGRGVVRRWAGGPLEWLGGVSTEPSSDAAKQRIRLLEPRVLRGVITLECLAEDAWRLACSPTGDPPLLGAIPTK